jgi:hypothetical protein
MSHPPLPWIVINMAHRTDRMELLRKAFPDQEIERFEAIRNEDPEIGCRESHLAVVRLAKERGYPWVCILEDDCDPYPEFQTSFPDVLTYLWNHQDDWEIYNGGPNPNMTRRHKGNMIVIEDWISAQFIIVNSSIYDKLLAHDDTQPKKIDDYYSTFKTLTSTPMLTRQLDTYSDLAKAVTNNIPLFEQSRAKLQIFGGDSGRGFVAKQK